MLQRAPCAVVALLVLSLAAAGCSRPSSPPANTGPSADSSAQAPSGPLPATCEAYLATLQTCVDRVSQRNPGSAARLRAQIASTRRAWSQMDPARLSGACQQANRFFSSVGRMMGCGS
jgi:hypothetical protein